ncbi:MAG: rhodanese-related sulfurtransferase [Bacteroidota bacterium]
MKKRLYNIHRKDILQKKVQDEEFERFTISFYRYVYLNDLEQLRDELYEEWDALGILGRIYIAEEGINAQISVPEHNHASFRKVIDNRIEFKDVPFKYAVQDNLDSFYKLKIKIRKKIVADGLDDDSFDVTNVGNHLSAKEFHELVGREDVTIVDMRNHYESEVGHFEGAITPDSDTFREELPIVEEKLEGKKDEKILLYCTGGIRCEKASAWLKHKGFNDVNQLHGGIIEYAQQIKKQGLESKFKGKNFVFDRRLGERITEEVISHCHQCGAPCDNHTNCANDECHLLFIQCDSCREKWDGCCKQECYDIVQLPIEDQRKHRKKHKNEDSLSIYKSRLRPKLKEILNKEDGPKDEKNP